MTSATAIAWVSWVPPAPDIAFSITTPNEIEPLVCDRRLLSQAVTNIVKNAVEAIEEKYKNSDIAATGRVDARLDIGAAGEYVIRVTDDGIGLPDIVRESTGSLATETVEEVRLQGMAADDAIARLVDRIRLRRRPALPSAP